MIITEEFAGLLLQEGSHDDNYRRVRGITNTGGFAGV